jgi:hypothetical protein
VAHENDKLMIALYSGVGTDQAELLDTVPWPVARERLDAYVDSAFVRSDRAEDALAAIFTGRTDGA